MESLQEKIEKNLQEQTKLQKKIDSFSNASLTRNQRKMRSNAFKELEGLKAEQVQLFEQMQKEHVFSKEEWGVVGLLPETINGITRYITQFEAIFNEPMAFWRNPGTLREFGYYTNKTDTEIRDILYEQQLNNGRIRAERRAKGENEDSE